MSSETVQAAKRLLAELTAAAQPAFITSESCGQTAEYRHVFKFRTLAELQAFGRAWNAAALLTAQGDSVTDFNLYTSPIAEAQPAPAAAPEFIIAPIVCPGTPDAHTLTLKIGVQCFRICGGLDFDTRGDAEWMAGQLRSALESMGQPATKEQTYGVPEGAERRFGPITSEPADAERNIQAKEEGAERAAYVEPRPTPEGGRGGGGGVSGIYSRPVQYPKQPENAMRARQGLSPLCFNRPDFPETQIVNDGLTWDGMQQIASIRNDMSKDCKAWAVHPAEDPATASVPGAEGWRCWGCRHLPDDPRVQLAAAGASAL